MAKFFRLPFGVSGDRASVPDDTQVDGTVSYEIGFGIDYELEQGVDPNAKDIPRDQSNQIYYDITDAIRQYQTESVPDFITSAENDGVAYSYVKFARVRYDAGSGDKVYESLVDSNTALPTNTSNWTEVKVADSVLFAGAAPADNAIARYDGVTGKIIQRSQVIIDDGNNITGVAALTATGLGTFSSTALNSTSPEQKFNETDGGADSKKWRNTASGNIFYLQALNDAENTVADVFSVTRSGVTPVIMKVSPVLQNVDNKPILPVQTFKFEDLRVTNTAGGGSTAGAWTQRPLNTLGNSDIPGATIPGANQVSLPAGTYLVSGWSIFGSANLSTQKGVCRLYNVTDAAVIAFSSAGMNSVNSSSMNVVQRFDAVKLILAATKTIELQYFVDVARATDGLGFPINLGSAQEKYAELIFTKIA